MRFAALVEVAPRAQIADPEGATIERALPALGHEGVSGVRVGKAVRFEVDAPDEAAARRLVDEISRTFLSNPVIEDVTVTLVRA